MRFVWLFWDISIELELLLGSLFQGTCRTPAHRSLPVKETGLAELQKREPAGKGDGDGDQDKQRPKQG